eukprot:4339791-Amphidinium_carterae.2
MAAAEDLPEEADVAWADGILAYSYGQQAAPAPFARPLHKIPNFRVGGHKCCPSSVPLGPPLVKV